jgi:aminoglycoside 6'-N-acetyltransferase
LNGSALQEIVFRPVQESDFPTLAGWLAQPHVCSFYQKKPSTPEEVALKYGPRIRGEDATLCHLALCAGAPFAYLQCYRNADNPDWVGIIGVNRGISTDFFVGEPGFLRRGFGRAALGSYLRRVAFPHYAGESCAYIAHEAVNTSALRCSQAVGFRPLRLFQEDGNQMVLLGTDRLAIEQAA